MKGMNVIRRDLLTSVSQYYSARVAEHGPTPQGVDWNSSESQELRFEQLLKLCEGRGEAFSIIDYGCGYGALAQFMRERGFDFRYYGFDISEPMIENARQLLADATECTFFSNPSHLPIADYTVASGVFNVKLDAEDELWNEYILDTLKTLARNSRNGFGFNMLTEYSDPEHMRPDLYYGDPLFFFLLLPGKMILA